MRMKAETKTHLFLLFFLSFREWDLEREEPEWEDPELELEDDEDEEELRELSLEDELLLELERWRRLRDLEKMWKLV